MMSRMHRITQYTAETLQQNPIMYYMEHYTPNRLLTNIHHIVALYLLKHNCKVFDCLRAWRTTMPAQQPMQRPLKPH